LDSLLERQHPTGPFFLGPEPTLADVCAVPFLARYEATYTTIVGAPSFSDSYSRISKTITAARAHPGFSPVLRSIASYLE
jgi:glutathione S-transferase